MTEAFWQGQFGDEYTERNADARRIGAQVALFARILSRTRGITSALELGPNVGHNLSALRSLLPTVRLEGVEINAKAGETCRRNLPEAWIHVGSVFDFKPARTWDLVFTHGVLIHLPQFRLGEVYGLMHEAANRYILVAEYFNPTPAEVFYRGHADKLFKRDFAGEMLDRFPDLFLVDYGFVYHRDHNFPSDDVTWFLMEKK